MDRASGRMELVLKEALHIGLLQPGLNRDLGTELPGCWSTVIMCTLFCINSSLRVNLFDHPDEDQGFWSKHRCFLFFIYHKLI